MDIPVVHIKSGKAGVIDSRDVIYLQTEEEYTVLHTKDNEYRPPVSLKHFFEVLVSEGFEFTGRASLVNLDKAKLYDENAKKLFFDKTRKGKSVKVSRRNVSKIKNKIPLADCER